MLRYSDKKIFFSVIAVIAAVVIDMEISNVYDIITTNTSTNSDVADPTGHNINRFRIALFIVIVAVFGLGQYFILGFVKQKSTAIRTKNNAIRLIHTTIAIVQVFLAAIFLLIISDIILNSYYYTGYLLGVLVISNLFTVAAMALLSKLLFSWYRTRRDLVLVLYGTGCILSVVVAAVSVYFTGSVLFEKPPKIFDFSAVFFPAFQTGSTMNILNYVYYFGGIGIFVLFWSGTVTLLRHYSRKLGKGRYWIVVSMPLAFFSAQLLISVLPLSLFIGNSNINYDNTDFIFYYSLIFTLSSPVGGILFGIPYLIIAKKKEIVNNVVIRDYLSIAAYGFILYFISGSATIIHTPYPPFGLATVSLSAISSYLILIGLYSSAVYVSSNTDIRKTLRKYVRTTVDATDKIIDEEESKFLDNIGFAEMEQQIEKTTTVIMRKQASEIREQTGIQLSSSGSEQEMKEYLNEVLDEVKKIKVKEEGMKGANL